jgi:hypothetical protein
MGGFVLSTRGPFLERIAFLGTLIVSTLNLSKSRAVSEHRDYQGHRDTWFPVLPGK